MKKRWMVWGASIVLTLAIVLGLGYLWVSKRGPGLTVVTWPGPYGRAQITGQILPFERTSRVYVTIRTYDGGTAELARQVRSKQYEWDVIDLELPDAVAACSLGLLERIDASSLPSAPNGTPAAQDFVPGATGPCWVASTMYSQVIAVAPAAFYDAEPNSLADYFDVKKFPGKRAMNRTRAKLNFEMALLADGVAPDQVYPMLSTPRGVARALAKLDSIREQLVWYSDAAEAGQMLTDRRAAMAAMPNWAVFDSNTGEPGAAKLRIVWDRQLCEFEVFGIPKGNPRRRLAADFIRFATQTRQLAGLSSWAAFGPARKSAVPLVRKHPELKVDMTPYLPTAHLETAFPVDDGWWRLHGADIEPLWQSWVTKEK